MAIYRKPVPSDILDLIGLVQRYCTDNNEPFDNGSIKAFLDFQISAIPSIVAESEGKVVGAISFIIVPSDYKKDLLIGKKIVVFVDPDYRNQGIGKELISKAESVCQKAGCKKFYFTASKAPSDYIPGDVEYMKELN